MRGRRRKNRRKIEEKIKSRVVDTRKGREREIRDEKESGRQERNRERKGEVKKWTTQSAEKGKKRAVGLP